MNAEAIGARALAEARPEVFWLDRPERPEPSPCLDTDLDADLVVVGGGFTGLWTALTAAEADPGRSIVVLEADTIAFGASGRNGGFCEASLTHGLENGVAHWPDEVDTLLRLGDGNLQGLLDVISRHGIDCSPEPTGALNVAVAPWQADSLADSATLHEVHGLSVTLLDAPSTRSEVDSPTYLGGIWHHDGVVMLDPARLAWGLRRAAESLGVRFFENTPARSIEAVGGGA